jgi:capsular polysaccharide biosynthesis protein
MHVSNVPEQSSITSIASQFGITSPKTSNVAEIVALLNSNILMDKVIKKHDLTNVLLSKKHKKKKESEQIWETARLLKKKIYKARENKREGVIELSAEYKDPDIAAKILTYILKELTDYMSSEAIRVAQTNKKYLESQVDRNADPLIKQKIYSLIAKQIETSMLAEVKENFAFKVLDPPKVPVRKIRPIIWKNILLAFFLSLFVGVFLAFFLEYYNNLKELRKTAKAE